MTAAVHFPWRAPLSADWDARWTALDASVRGLEHASAEAIMDVCAGLRRLTSQQLGPREQFKLEATARHLLRSGATLAPLRKFRIGLIGNRTLSFLVNPLRAAGLSRGLLLDAVEAPYDSVAAFALGGCDAFADEKLDGAVLVLDENGFAPREGVLDCAQEDAALASADAFLHQLADAVRERHSVQMMVATIPHPGARVASADLALGGSDARFIARLNAAIADGAMRGDWIVWDLANLAARVGLDTWFDPIRFHEAKTPFRVEMCPLAADHLSRVIAAMTGKTCRALILDLDNTLWGGVIGDDGLAGLVLGHGSPEGEAFLAFQRFVLDLRCRGIVLAVCSKNTDEIAREPFRSHPEMLLKEEHIAIFQANWEDKATNIKAIAEALALGLDSIAFADDNAAERERVRQELPLVSVPELGGDPAYFPARIADSGVFEHLVLNADDLGRAQSYENNARRAELHSRVGNYDEYLASLGMTMEVSRFDAVGRARIAQLINKSNQFNLTTRRYSEEDVRDFEDDRENILCWQARLSDAFGAHGTIAIVIVRKNAGVWTIDTWLQSCRVLKRGVEEALMNLLLERARAEGATRIDGEYIPTPRNQIVADFFARLGFEEAGSGANRYVCNPAAFKPLKSFINLTVHD